MRASSTTVSAAIPIHDIDATIAGAVQVEADGDNGHADDETSKAAGVGVASRCGASESASTGPNNGQVQPSTSSPRLWQGGAGRERLLDAAVTIDQREERLRQLDL
ncbi:hypothetical protein MFIFM68171_02896 [Madurella fahalii]|uniref:Uncharacterized protein n=1 Tax=Madurella fahalii TaxID=1157608 RepID=A0ABQ0G4M1_9PEZI